MGFDLDVRYSVAGALLATLLHADLLWDGLFFLRTLLRAYFPTIFAFPLIYTSIVIFLDYLEQPNRQTYKISADLSIPD